MDNSPKLAGMLPQLETPSRRTFTGRPLSDDALHWKALNISIIEHCKSYYQFALPQTPDGVPLPFTGEVVTGQWDYQKLQVPF
jgi:hypothetical protein